MEHKARRTGHGAYEYRGYTIVRSEGGIGWLVGPIGEHYTDSTHTKASAVVLIDYYVERGIV